MQLNKKYNENSVSLAIDCFSESYNLIKSHDINTNYHKLIFYIGSIGMQWSWCTQQQRKGVSFGNGGDRRVRRGEEEEERWEEEGERKLEKTKKDKVEEGERREKEENEEMEEKGEKVEK